MRNHCSKIQKMEFYYLNLLTLFFKILAFYLDTLFQCLGVEISYFLVYHMPKYLVYQARYRQLRLDYGGLGLVW